jgi:hypothetical protein
MRLRVVDSHPPTENGTGQLTDLEDRLAKEPIRQDTPGALEEITNAVSNGGYFSKSAPKAAPPGTTGGQDDGKRTPGMIRVLVADDNRVNVEVVSRMLKMENVCDITVAKVRPRSGLLVTAFEVGSSAD